MPRISQSLSKYDLGFLRILAKKWSFNDQLQDKRTAIEQLCTWMTDPQNLHIVLQSLSTDAQRALEDLRNHQGRLPSAVFTRKYGEIRQVGAAKRDREAILLSPHNASEQLFFQALVFQDFFEGEHGIEEYVYIPNELLAALPHTVGNPLPRFHSVVSSEQVETIGIAHDLLFDDVCTSLAWLRMDKITPKRLAELKQYLLLANDHPNGLPLPLKAQFLTSLLSEAALLDSSGSPLPEPTRTFLSMPRLQAIKSLYETWLKSTSINELKQLDELECLGAWENDPISARLFIIEQIRSLTPGVWYELGSFIEYLRDHFPDFQRPGGNYDVWLIRRRSDGKFLQGFESWYSVEGELLRYLISGPLSWFGVVELGFHKQEASVIVFRITQFGEAILQSKMPDGDLPPQEKPQVLPSGKIAIPRRFLAPVRYQIARFCEWEGYQKEQYLYRITPNSLRHAQQKGLKSQQLLRLLQRHAENLPPNLVHALRRWEQHATEIHLQRLSILRVRSPEILEQIKKSRCSKYLQQILNPTMAVIASGQEKKLAEQLLTLGYLIEIESPRKNEPGASDSP
jgi:hypothetical protein